MQDLGFEDGIKRTPISWWYVQVQVSYFIKYIAYWGIVTVFEPNKTDKVDEENDDDYLDIACQNSHTKTYNT